MGVSRVMTPSSKRPAFSALSSRSAAAQSHSMPTPTQSRQRRVGMPKRRRRGSSGGGRRPTSEARDAKRQAEVDRENAKRLLEERTAKKRTSTATTAARRANAVRKAATKTDADRLRKDAQSVASHEASRRCPRQSSRSRQGGEGEENGPTRQLTQPSYLVECRASAPAPSWRAAPSEHPRPSSRVLSGCARWPT